MQEKTGKILSPKKDFVFQVLFGEIESEEITKDFLEAILQEKITKVDLSQNPILRRMYPESKMGILDVMAVINEKTKCNIEMQMTERPDIIPRILYYWARTYIKGIKKSESYEKLERTIVILIANFEIDRLKEMEYSTKWNLIETKERKVILTEQIEIDIIEMPKIYKKRKIKNKELLQWLYFLENPESEEVKKIMEENRVIKKAGERLEEISQDIIMQRINEWKEMGEYEEFLINLEREEEREKIKKEQDKIKEEQDKIKEEQDKMKEEQDKMKEEQDKVKEEKEKIRKDKNKLQEKQQELQSKEKKLNENKIEIVRKMKSKNISINMIEEITGLTKDEIENI